MDVRAEQKVEAEVVKYPVGWFRLWGRVRSQKNRIEGIVWVNP